MKAFTNINPRSLEDAVAHIRQASQKQQSVAIAGGGSDLLVMVKEGLVAPDVVVHLGSVRGLDQIVELKNQVRIGGLVSLDALAHDPLIRSKYAVLAEAAGAVGTPQIRNAGTLAGNVAQRPWCWYYRNGFSCYKNGGGTCYSFNGENEFHAIFGGGPSFMVHPSDTAPALIALDAKFRIVGPAGERTVAAADFFTLPRTNPAKENTMGNEEILAEVILPATRPNTKGTYHKILDRESWTHAVVSLALVLELENDVCKSARVVLGGVAPIPWRLPKVEAMLTGQKITADLAARAGELAIEGAQPLAKNRYKLPLTKNVVKRTIVTLGAAA